MATQTPQGSKGLGQYLPLALAAGVGSMLGSGIIVGLSSTITVWQDGLGLDNGQVGVLSGVLTFAIAFGSLFGGRIAERVGRVPFFNWINLLYAAGALACVFTNSFAVLLVGLIIAGFASGADLPVSMTVVSHDAPNDAMSARLVSATQVFWQLGVFISFICAFLVSTMSGATGGRIVFAILAAFAVFTWLWRTLSPKLRELHKAADERAAIRRDAYAGKKVSVFQVLFGKDKKILLTYFISILVFYVGWNLLANTWGQFQTFMFVKADASQTLATGLGIVLNLVTLIINIVFASIAGGKYRNRAFFVGIGITFVAMVSLALGGTNLWIIVGAVAVMNLGSPLAGEAIYKVWTQESFPIEIRASMQGFINGFSRLVCGLFALVTPALVLPATIKTTMWGFAVIVIIEAVAGTIMIKSQKRYGTDEERIEASMSDKAFTAQSAQ
ncbi:MFS transporter [Bifidobacterium psychraerophilum]|jgi:inositol transporter-like SP family MFS transporter|uniref:MFS transporter n=1 Tax=Bifidobacterium psychraerophilum TaxID=218140 RepID=UPI0023F25D8B|nr:MFS transporter [Bifidobacterium psychraerophilum]MCI1661152.1 MFS transporter [Bifidobacterium psychraerophilum]MCI1804756.1 MFS transporter [Bifidobacterium psychraerophilum]MCI2177324.1 MFS transporter [Bifidobacterium psychraerophilum]MCI2182224.1 MFS transporter [Bifidobacterium psychraerophilum]